MNFGSKLFFMRPPPPNLNLDAANDTDEKILNHTILFHSTDAMTLGQHNFNTCLCVQSQRSGQQGQGSRMPQ